MPFEIEDVSDKRMLRTTARATSRCMTFSLTWSASRAANALGIPELIDARDATTDMGGRQVRSSRVTCASSAIASPWAHGLRGHGRRGLRNGAHVFDSLRGLRSSLRGVCDRPLHRPGCNRDRRFRSRGIFLTRTWQRMHTIPGSSTRDVACPCTWSSSASATVTRRPYTGGSGTRRMAPEGLAYISSWVTEDLSTCYQLMENSRPGRSRGLDAELDRSG